MERLVLLVDPSVRSLMIRVILLAFLVVIAKPIFARFSLLRKNILPPGPSLLTRVLDGRNHELLAVKLMRWSQEYGGVMSLMDFVQLWKPTIVLSTPTAAIDLLEKRGYIYSSRPRNILAGEICYRGWKGTLQQAGTKLRKFRTIMGVTLNRDASKKFRGLEDMENKLMLRELLYEKDNEKYQFHFRRALHSVAFCVAFGQRMDHLDPKHLEFFLELERFFQSHSLPGQSLVDHFPILLRLPRCLQWFRKEADKQGDREERFFVSCLNQTSSALKKGHPLLGSAARVLEKREKYDYQDLAVALVSSSPYTAGVTTTLGSFDAFILAALLHPHIVKKGQEEIGTVVGTRRMPGFEDYDSLPYIRAIVKETLRWHPFIPLGIPHATTEDDIYDGMYIPAGSTIIANIYAITRNVELFPDPEEFRPERFIDNPDPLFKNYNLTFGFGRRICPGQHVAGDQLFLLISRLLWAFNIVSVKGNLDISGYQAQHGRFGPPLPLPYKLIPRGEHVRSLIVEQALIAEKEAGSWECFRTD